LLIRCADEDDPQCLAYFHRVFASELSARIAWLVIIVRTGALVIQYADRLQ
jgi:hypothetical protein